MPDSTGKLTPEEYQAAVNWINTRWINQVPCEMCGATRRWNTGGYIVSPPNLTAGGVRLQSGYYYPTFPVTCMNCGNTKYVNAFISGVMHTG